MNYKDHLNCSWWLPVTLGIYKTHDSLLDKRSYEFEIYPTWGPDVAAWLMRD